MPQEQPVWSMPGWLLVAERGDLECAGVEATLGETGVPRLLLHVPLLLIKTSSPPSSCSAFPIAKAPLGAEKLSFASTSEKLRSCFALRLPTGARQAPTEVELQVKALSGSHSPSTDFSQHD